MSDTHYDTILISLDELFDTRLATLAKINPAEAKKVLWNGWNDRVMDHFPTFDMDEYRRLYAARDVHTLALAKTTRIPVILRDTAARVLAKSARTPWQYKPRVCINTWPYQLQDTTISLIIQQVVMLTNESMDVYVEHISDEALTPEYIGANFSTVVMYDYSWLERHTEELKRNPIPHVSLLSPMVFQQYVELFPKEDPFEVITRAAQPLVNLVWIEPKMLSIAINILNVVKP